MGCKCNERKHNDCFESYLNPSFLYEKYFHLKMDYLCLLKKCGKENIIPKNKEMKDDSECQEKLLDLEEAYKTLEEKYKEALKLEIKDDSECQKKLLDIEREYKKIKKEYEKLVRREVVSVAHIKKLLTECQDKSFIMSQKMDNIKGNICSIENWQEFVKFKEDFCTDISIVEEEEIIEKITEEEEEEVKKNNILK